MGAGKSTVGRELAARRGRSFVDLDSLLEQRAGMTIPELFESRGELAFRALEAELLPEALSQGEVVALGGGTPLPAENWRVIRRAAETMYLEAPLLTLLQRLGDAEDRPLLHGRSHDELERLFEARRSRYEQAELRVDAARPLELVIEEALAKWGA